MLGAASQQASRSQLVETKSVFVNMSHLHVGAKWN